MKLLRARPLLLTLPASSTLAPHWSSLPVADVRKALLWMSPRARASILPPIRAPKRPKKKRCWRRQERVWCNFDEDEREQGAVSHTGNVLIYTGTELPTPSPHLRVSIIVGGENGPGLLLQRNPEIVPAKVRLTFR